MQTIMDSENMKQSLTDLFEKYSVSTIDSCSVKRTMSAANVIASAGTWLVVLSGVIGIFALVATCSACCIGKKYVLMIYNNISIKMLTILNKCLNFRYKNNSKKLLGSNRTPPESFAPGTSVLYTEPIYGPY